MSSEDYGAIDFSMEENATTTNDQEQQDKFQQLYSLDLSDKVESKNGLSYVSWANAWAAFKKVYPNATYTIVKNPQTNLPYFVDPDMGIMVYTQVCADRQTYEMFLPVMDGANKSMRTTPYTYQVWDKQNRCYVDRKVEAATMFDINKTVMRCLVKNLAMFGLGLYLYQGEDLPENIIDNNEQQPQQAPKARKSRKSQQQDRYAGIRMAISTVSTTQELTALYRQHENEVKNNPQILALFTARKEELLNAA